MNITLNDLQSMNSSLFISLTLTQLGSKKLIRVFRFR